MKHTMHLVDLGVYGLNLQHASSSDVSPTPVMDNTDGDCLRTKGGDASNLAPMNAFLL